LIARVEEVAVVDDQLVPVPVPAEPALEEQRAAKDRGRAVVTRVAFEQLDRQPRDDEEQRVDLGEQENGNADEGPGTAPPRRFGRRRPFGGERRHALAGGLVGCHHGVQSRRPAMAAAMLSMAGSRPPVNGPLTMIEKYACRPLAVVT